MSPKHLSRIGLITSGGDAPGMNACIRAVVKGARSHEVEVVGINYGGIGLLRNSTDLQDFALLVPNSVTGIVNQSGTVLKTSREEQVVQFLSSLDYVAELTFEPEQLTRSSGAAKLMGNLAREALEHNRIDALIMIGGDQTCRAAIVISEACQGKLPVIVIPATIDNDVAATSQTIGFDSAVSAAVQAIDSMRASAISHGRIFIVEVMGRRHGHIAVEVALATGAEEVLIPERTYKIDDLDMISKRLRNAKERGHESAIIIVAEGVESQSWGTQQVGRRHPAIDLEYAIRNRIRSWEIRVAILGYLQRGAWPTPYTRNISARLALRAVDEMIAAIREKRARPPLLVGINGLGRIGLYPLHGDMVRRSRRTVLAAEEQVRRLAY